MINKIKTMLININTLAILCGFVDVDNLMCCLYFSSNSVAI